MGKIVVTEFVSLDGVIEARVEGGDYEHAGWTFAIDRGEEGNQFSWTSCSKPRLSCSDA
jgi:hypothetical protein